MKSTRVRIGLIATLIAVALATCWMLQLPPEDPLCKGVRLSEWLERPEWLSGKPLMNPTIQPEDVRAIAPKAAPFLAYYLRCKYPRNKKSIASWTPAWLQAKLPPSWINTKVVGSAWGCHRALAVLGWLGADAEPALPTLVMMQSNPDYVGLWSPCARAIHRIGPASWPAVIKIWHSGPVVARKNIIMELPCRFQSPAVTEADRQLAINLLLEACSNPDPWIQYDAIKSLERCRMIENSESRILDPAVPVLIRCTEVGTNNVRVTAAQELRNYPEHFRTIIPAFKKMAEDPDPKCSKVAKQALERIERMKSKGK